MITQYSGMALASFGLAFYLSWKLMLVILAGTPIVMILLPFFSSKVQPNIESQAEKLSQVAKLCSNMFYSIETVKFCSAEDSELSRYTSVIKEAGIFFFRQAFWNALQTGVVRLVMLSMFVQGFWFGSILLDKGQITSSKILTSFWAAILAVQALMQIMPHIVLLERGRAAGQKLKAVIGQMETTSMELNPIRLQRPSKCIGDINFNSV
jgi:ATP-binding cassette, subfamily B (MDR/TAP), member 1